MNDAIATFRQNIAAVRNLGAIYSWLQNNATGLDASDILRAQIANISSALDKFIHDVVREGSILIIIGQRKQPENNAVLEKFAATQYKLFAVKSQELLAEISSKITLTQDEILELTQVWQDFKNEEAAKMQNEFYERMKKDSYLAPQNMADTLKQIGVTDLWAKVENWFKDRNLPLDNLPYIELVTEEKKVKNLQNAGKKVETSLEFIYKNRNLIVHEFDLNYATSSRNPIYQEDVNPIIDFIENVCEAIFHVVTNNP